MSVARTQLSSPGRRAKAAKTPAFNWVNTALGNIKAAIGGTYRVVGEKHVPRCLAEFEYRFNQRYDLANMIPRLAVIATETAPMLYRLLKLPERKQENFNTRTTSPDDDMSHIDRSQLYPNGGR